MRVRMLQSWKLYRCGQEIDLPDGVANVLVRRRLASCAETGMAVCAPAETLTERDEPLLSDEPKEKPRRPSRR